MDQCPYCWHDGNKPIVSVLSLGLKAYLAIPQTIQMVPFHCLIVPTTHVNSTLDLEDDSWDEIRVTFSLTIEFSEKSYENDE
jgi:diadenosine tetraphosphate (Ap4A) HIT family hydrolase